MRAMGPTVSRTSMVLETNKLIRNTYTLLSITLLTSALAAGVSIVVNPPPMTGLLCFGGAMVLIMFVLPRTANSATGLPVVFLITSIMGFGLGPMLTSYLSLPGGSQIVMTAFGGTAAIFLGLSGYALMTRRDFSFMGGFIFAGIIVVLVAAIANIFLNMPALALAVSSVVIFLMSAKILYDTSQMVHDQGDGNYLLMTVSLYLSMFNIFTSLLHILGVMRDD